MKAMPCHTWDYYLTNHQLHLQRHPHRYVSGNCLHTLFSILWISFLYSRLCWWHSLSHTFTHTHYNRMLIARCIVSTYSFRIGTNAKMALTSTVLAIWHDFPIVRPKVCNRDKPCIHVTIANHIEVRFGPIIRLDITFNTIASFVFPEVRIAVRVHQDDCVKVNDDAF